jgi:transcriptional regulator of acetoin/glycerol metabolism
LRNVVERAVILADTNEIHLLDLPEKLFPGSPQAPAPGVQIGAKVSLMEIETEHIARVMKQAATMSEAARILGISRDTLHRKKKEIARAPHVQDG